VDCRNNRTCRATTDHNTDYTLRTPRTFPCSLRLSDHLRGGGGVMWEPPTVEIIHCQATAS
jgi:hypothetical protein